MARNDKTRGISEPGDSAFARAVLESTPAVVYVYDVQAEKSVYQNRRLSELLGHGPDASPALLEWQSFIHPEDAARFPAQRDRLKAIREGETLSWEFRMRASDGTWRWFQSRDVLLSWDEKGRPLLVVGNAADISEQKETEARHALLAGELRHRSKNFGAIVQAIARQTVPKDEAAAQPFNALVARLITLLRTGDLVLESEPRVAPLRTVLETTLSPFVGRKECIAIEGPEAALVEEAAGALALAMHELATNALKYGALANAGGTISVRWAREGKKAELVWKEKNGPLVTAPMKDGFGMRVIRQGAPGGKVDVDFETDGLCCRFALSVCDMPS
jgi:PAS domain S-box-containing protein